MHAWHDVHEPCIVIIFCFGLSVKKKKMTADSAWHGVLCKVAGASTNTHAKVHPSVRPFHAHDMVSISRNACMTRAVGIPAS